jgi:hypothetical protein
MTSEKTRSMPKKLPTADGKRMAGAAAAATPARAKKTCPHRTPQTPFERLDEETTYIVNKMVGMRVLGQVEGLCCVR